MKTILLLEDDPERLERFSKVATEISCRLIQWRSAFDFLADLDQTLPTADLISLDHDLLSINDEPDLGDGVLATKALAARTPCCPVIIHTSNGVRGDWMEGELQLSGWSYHRVAPIGDDWIEVDWRRSVTRLLRKNKSKAS